jgi:nitrogen regulatory protein PII
VTDDLVDTVISSISTAASSGKIGDGKIWTIPVGTLVRIRTGELGDEAV